MSALLSLAGRVEALDGPNMAIDQDIHEVVVIGAEKMTDRAYPHCKRYTRSIDDAATLIPDGFEWCLSVDNVEGCVVTIPSNRLMDDAVHALAKSPAMALTAAALRVREAANLSRQGEGVDG